VLRPAWKGTAVSDRLKTPVGIAIDSTGTVLVGDHDGNRVVRFSPRGRFLQQWTSIARPSDLFSFPYGVAVDPAGHVFLADNLNQRVEELSSGGRLIRSWAATFSSSGAVPDDALAVDAHGDVYVGNEDSMTVDRYTPSGQYLSSVSGPGPGAGSFRSISGIAVDARGRIYVADRVARAISVFSPSGALLARWTASRFPALGYPRAVAVDSAGNIYAGGGRQILEIAPLA
jgi:DNA-binding beta-propeller fold protein YncE